MSNGFSNFTARLASRKVTLETKKAHPDLRLRRAAS
jgi:hypothetical protein